MNVYLKSKNNSVALDKHDNGYEQTLNYVFFGDCESLSANGIMPPIVASPKKAPWLLTHLLLFRIYSLYSFLFVSVHFTFLFYLFFFVCTARYLVKAEPKLGAEYEPGEKSSGDIWNRVPCFLCLMNKNK